MTRKELIDNISKETGVLKKDADKVLTSFVRNVNKADGITLKDLGGFKHVILKAYTARNPRTGAVVEVPDRRVLKFHRAVK